MGDLSTLDRTQPPDAELLSQGASRIREERDAILNSFDVEHALTGPHTFLFGNQGARPAAGNAGRIYLNTTDNRVERDNGTIFQMLHTVAGYYNTGTTIQPVSNSNTLVTSQVVDIPAGGFLVALGMARWNVQAADNNLSKFLFLTDGGVSGTQFGPTVVDVFHATAGSENMTQIVFGMNAAPTTGSRLITLIARVAGANPGSIVENAFAVFII